MKAMIPTLLLFAFLLIGTLHAASVYINSTAGYSPLFRDASPGTSITLQAINSTNQTASWNWFLGGTEYCNQNMGALLTGSSSPFYTVQTSQATNATYYCVGAVQNNLSIIVPPTSFEVVVNPSLQVNVTASNSTVDLGQGVWLHGRLIGGNSSTYGKWQWYYNKVDSNSSGTAITPANQTSNYTQTLNQTYYYYLKASDGRQNVTSKALAVATRGEYYLAGFNASVNATVPAGMATYLYGYSNVVIQLNSPSRARLNVSVRNMEHLFLDNYSSFLNYGNTYAVLRFNISTNSSYPQYAVQADIPCSLDQLYDFSVYPYQLINGYWSQLPYNTGSSGCSEIIILNSNKTIAWFSSAGVVNGASPIVSNTMDGYNVTNIAQGSNFHVSFGNALATHYEVVENYITPTGAGITINGKSYDLNANQTIAIGSNSTEAIYLKLAGVAWIPMQQTINLLFQAVKYTTTSTTTVSTSTSTTSSSSSTSIPSTTTIMPSNTLANTTNSTSTSSSGGWGWIWWVIVAAIIIGIAYFLYRIFIG